jgi:hypothetical protein
MSEIQVGSRCKVFWDVLVRLIVACRVVNCEQKKKRKSIVVVPPVMMPTKTNTMPSRSGHKRPTCGNDAFRTVTGGLR